jgi:hypothetical protein
MQVMPQTPLPGARWFSWLRNATLRVGVLTGVYLSVVLGGWLVVANRVPESANYAGSRNLTAAALMVLLMLIPACRFVRSPLRIFYSGITAWSVLTATFLVLGLFFQRLYSRMNPFQVFMLGAIAYGVIAVVAWVLRMTWATRHHSLAVSRRRSY